jgi:hypothetical protein
VSEGAAQSVPARVRFSATRDGVAGPVAIASAPGTANAGGRVLLNGLRSRRAAGHRWTQVAGPWIAIEGADGARAQFRPTVPGLYSFELEVDDGAGVRSAPAQVSVLVFDAGVR